MFFGLQITSSSRFRTGSFEQLDSFVQACSDRLSLVPRTSSRPSPAALFCFPRWFPLSSNRLSFVSRTSSRPSPTGSLLFSAAISLNSRPHSFVFRSPFRLILLLIFFCLKRSLPFVVDLLQTLGCQWSPMSAFCLANVFHNISLPSAGFAYAVPLFCPLKMAFWSRFMRKCRLAVPQEWFFPQYGPGKWFVVQIGVLSCNWAAGKRRKHGKRAVYALAKWTATTFCKGIWQWFLQGRGLWTRYPVIFIHCSLSWAFALC